jgi:RIO kinase 1
MSLVPTVLEDLIDLGVIDEVLRPLQAGKEAQVYLVNAKGRTCVAKVYKDAATRSFKHRSTYTEGRTVQNTRQQRAMSKGSKYGKMETETAWRNAEVDTLYLLHAAGVRVPTPYDFVDGVLIMELIGDGHGGPAPRLVDLRWSASDAEALLVHLVHETAKMLCAGIIHGDLSDFNILVEPDGPVIIDFPQAIDPASNTQARKLLIRDVRNLQSFLGRFSPKLKRLKYAEEMWALFEKNELTPETRLTGRFKRSDRNADIQSIVSEIQDVARENEEKLEATGGMSKYAARKARRVEEEREARAADTERIERMKAKAERQKHEDAKRKAAGGQGKGQRGAKEEDGDRPKRRRKRRRNRGGRGRGEGSNS